MLIYRVSFHNNGQLYQLHAEHVATATLYGFVEVGGLLFDEHTSIVIDPAEERLKAEFEGVQQLMLPMHTVARIEQVARKGKNKILELDGSTGNITPFPMPPSGQGSD